jgi:putative phage-type endonuclease
MTLHTFPDIEQGSEEWLQLRLGVVTASVVGQLITPATIRAASNDKSRSLIAQLAAERITGRAEPVFVNDDMMRGTLHEPFARDRYAETQGVEVEQVGFMVREFSGGVRIGVSPDGLIADDGGLEVKCPRAKTHVQTILADEVPSYYMAQVQTSLVVSGRDWWDFVSFCSGLPLYTKRVTPDAKWRDAIITAATNAELAIAAMVTRWNEATADLPATEYIPNDMDLVI